jgi:hypothetical protein
MKVVAYVEEKQNLPPDRLAVLAKKIYDKGYLDQAIQRMAFVMSKHLVADPYTKNS